MAVNVNEAGTRWLTYSIFAVGLLVYYLLPVLAGIFTEAFGFSARQTGLLLSADMTASTIATFSARYWIHRCRWRMVFPCTVLCLVIGNVLCAFTESFTSLFLLRYLAGCGAGLMVAFMYATVAASENPDREFAYAMTLQVLLGAVVLNVSASLISNLGEGALFVLAGVVSLIPLCFYAYLPTSNPLTTGRAYRHNEEKGTDKLNPTIFIALMAVGLFFVSMNSIWSFMERIGDAEGFALEFITMTLSISLVFSFTGALVPAWLAGRARRIVLISSGYLMLLVSIFTLGRHPDAMTYLVTLCIYNFFYSFVIPFQNGWVASLDISGRTVVLLPVAQGIGIAIGPVLSGLVVVDNQYSNIAYVSIVFLLVSYGFFFLLAKRVEERLLNGETSG